MKRILMLGNDSSVKGGITTVINQFKEHKWKNVKIKFIPTYKDDNSIVKIYFFIIAYAKIVINLIFDRPDIVHIHMSYKASFTRANLIHKCCKRFKVNDIIHLHGSEFKKWYDSCELKKQNKVKKLLQECKLMVVLGKEWENRIKEIEPATKMIVVSNTVKVQEKSVKYNRVFNILFLGVLIKRKGVDDLLKAIKVLNEKQSLNNVKVIIAGTGEEEKNLKERAKLYKIENHIEFVGWIDNEAKIKLLENSQLMVLPSYNEGLPMSILEGMSYGLPIIATYVGDIPAAVVNGKNGYLVKPGDYEQLAGAIEKVIKMNRIEWENLSQKSKLMVREKFSDEKFFENFEKIYCGEKE